MQRCLTSGISNSDEFTWRAHPARSRPVASAGSVLIIAAMAAAVLASFGPIWAAGAALILALSLNRFYLPTRFAIDSNGIVARYPLRTQRLRWQDVRRFVHDKNGGYLSTRSRSSRMDGFAGMHLLFGPDRDATIELIQSRMAQSLPAVSHDGGRSCSA